MGMDVYGKKPTAEVGRYFRNNVWYWHPLWDYVTEVSPDLAAKVEYAYSNTGDGLGARDSETLARILTAELDSGRTAEYESQYKATIAALPDDECWHCHGTGTWTEVAVRTGCNVCAGTGKVRPWAAWKSFVADNVAEFRDFVAASGGFEIW
ncbi:MAG: hypothetical protein ACM37V_15995 [Gemmatimonadota bacterium]